MLRDIGPMELIIFPVIFISLAIYFIPTIIATVRHHKNTLGIVLVNVFTGWTFFGWVAALVWSVVRQ